MIDTDVVLGSEVTIFSEALVNLFGCRIGDGSFVGPFVEITRGVVVGRRCKIESHSFVCDSVIIEDDVFIGHGAMFTNDLYPRVDRAVQYIPTFVRSHASIGSNATVVCGIEVGAWSVVGAGSVVTKSIPPYAIAAGNPARILRQFNSGEEMTAYMNTRQHLKQK